MWHPFIVKFLLCSALIAPATAAPGPQDGPRQLPAAPYTIEDVNSGAMGSKDQLAFGLDQANQTGESSTSGQQVARGEIRLEEFKAGPINMSITSSPNEDATSQPLRNPLGEPNSTGLVRHDNHHYVSRQPARSRPTSIELLPPLSVTAPPIRRTMDVVAENYTTRKIADEANIFALRLLHQLNVEKLGSHNIVQSPFAIYQGLALLLTGAMGDTSRELDRILLGSQSVYENTKLTHDQDRVRLMASFGDVVRQLQQTSTSHFRSNCSPSADCSKEAGPSNELDSVQYRGGSQEQHVIVANNLLFSPSAYELSNEFKSSLNRYFNNTALTRIEVGSTESIQVVNKWIRGATAGLIPALFSKRNTFDEFNVMTLLSTSWLSQEWEDDFRRVSNSLRSNIKLKGQMKSSKQLRREEPLMEFVDDQRKSHFVEFIQSNPSRHIQHYHSALSGSVVDIVVVPLRDSNQKMVFLTPLPASAMGLNQSAIEFNEPPNVPAPDDYRVELPDSSMLSKFIATISGNPRRAMRSLWNTIAPDIITKQYLTMQMATRPRNSSSSGTENRTIMRVKLSIPLMRTEADVSLTASLNHIGIVNSFDPTQANFIGINGHPFNYNKLHLSNVLYKTTFNLNELGINYDRTVKTLESMRLNASTNRQRGSSDGSGEQVTDQRELVDEIKLNKPFVYLICDVKSKLVLYTGVVRNPAKESL